MIKILWKCTKKCCRLCQRSQSLTDSSTKILKAGVRVEGNVWFMTNVWNYCKSIFDVFWLGIGKPIKHLYDFCRYIRSEAGTVIGICIKKCCRKSTQKVKIAGKMVLEQVK